MTSTPTEPASPPGGTGSPGASDDGPRVTGHEVRDLGRLRRTTAGSPEGRHVAGVGGGIARHLDIDPIVIRVALVVLVFFGGAGLLLYAVAWLVLPEEGSERAVVPLDERSRGFVLYAGLGLAVIAILGDTVGHFDIPWGFGVTAAVVLAVLVFKDNAWPSLRRQRPDGQPHPDAPPAARPVDLTKTGRAAPPEPARWSPPRRRGPILFWPTLAVLALAEGVLGIVDGAGADVAGSGYAALAVGIIGGALLLGAFWGRAGGLILAGFVALAALVVSTAFEVWDVEADHLDVRPTTAAQLAPSYDFDLGDISIDLRDVTDLSALDRRTLDISGHVGQIEVIVPSGLTVVAHGDINGPGDIGLFGDDRGGIDTVFDTTRVGTPTAGRAAPTLTIDSQLDIGDIRVVDETGSIR